MCPIADGNRATFARRRAGWATLWILLVLGGGCSEQDMVIQPKVKPLGSLRDALYWKQENIERWLAQGEEDALEAAGQNISVLNCFGR